MKVVPFLVGMPVRSNGSSFLKSCMFAINSEKLAAGFNSTMQVRSISDPLISGQIGFILLLSKCTESGAGTNKIDGSIKSYSTSYNSAYFVWLLPCYHGSFH